MDTAAEEGAKTQEGESREVTEGAQTTGEARTVEATQTPGEERSAEGSGTTGETQTTGEARTAEGSGTTAETRTAEGTQRAAEASRNLTPEVGRKPAQGSLRDLAH